MGLSVTGALVDLRWSGPAFPGGGSVPAFRLTFVLPDGEGSFDPSTVSAKTCGCKAGGVSPNGLSAECKIVGQPGSEAAECRVPAGLLEIHHIVDGKCESRGGCVTTTVVEIVMNKDAIKGTPGSVSFVIGSAHEQSSCVSSPLFG